MLTLTSRLFLQKSSSILTKNSLIVGLGLNRKYTTYRYTDSHEWVTLDGNKGTFGITNYAQRTLGDIVFVESPFSGTTAKQGDPIGVIESVKAASDIFAPMSLKITETNSDVNDEPELVNMEPYGSWICKFEATSPEEFNKLLTKEQYEKLIEEKEDTSN